MNIIEYLDLYKDKSLKEEAFNEVDGLVLAELIYAKFEGILNKDSDISLKEANDAFWKIHTEKEIMDQKSYTKRAPFLMKEMANSKRYEGTRLKNYVTFISLKDVEQFAAITISLPDGTDYISYRGTDGTVAGWMEDFKFSYGNTLGQEHASKYLNDYHFDNIKPLRLGGHSKGANLAVYAGVFAKEEIVRNIIKIYSYDGPGFKDEIINSNKYQRVLPRVISIIPKDCMIGLMMKNKYQTIITNSDNFSIYQHDAYAWHIIDNHFEEVDKRSEDSILFERILNDWLIKCDESKREAILTTFCSLIENNEIDFKDNEKLSTTFFYYLLIKSPRLENEDKQIIISSIKDLLGSTSSILSDEFKNKLNILSKKIENEVQNRISKRS